LTLTPEIILAIGTATAPTAAVLINAVFTYLNGRKLARLADTANATHSIVNGQSTAMVASIADLSARVAGDNPRDRNAQVAAVTASQNLADKKAENVATKPSG
jgi:hypothetical protein